MAELLFQAENRLRIYKVIRSNDGQVKISETRRQDGHREAFHISRKSFDDILAAPGPAQYQAAEVVYQEARARREARRAARVFGHER